MKSTEKIRVSEKCEHCGEPLWRKRVNVYRFRNKRHVLFQGIQALVCDACGHRVFEADSVEAMEFLLEHKRLSAKRAELILMSGR